MPCQISAVQIIAMMPDSGVTVGARVLVMPEEWVNPEDCLRSLAAEALLRAHPDRPLFPVSLGLMAAANAFVVLGLLPQTQAEAILADHKSALERKGLGNTGGVTKRADGPAGRSRVLAVPDGRARRAARSAAAGGGGRGVLPDLGGRGVL
jgi:hypothetical protein